MPSRSKVTFDHSENHVFILPHHSLWHSFLQILSAKMGDHYKTYQPPLALTDEDDAYVSVNSPSILATSSIAADEDDSLLDEEEEEPAENESIDSALLEKYLNRPLAVTDYDEDDELIEDDLDVGGKGKGKSTTLKRKGKVKAPSSAKKGGKKAPTMVKAAPNTKKRKAEEYTRCAIVSGHIDC